MEYCEYSNVTTLCKIYHFVRQSLHDKPKIPMVTISPNGVRSAINHHRDLLKEIGSHGILWIFKCHNFLQEISFYGTVFFPQAINPCGNVIEKPEKTLPGLDIHPQEVPHLIPAIITDINRYQQRQNKRYTIDLPISPWPTLQTNPPMG